METPHLSSRDNQTIWATVVWKECLDKETTKSPQRWSRLKTVQVHSQEVLKGLVCDEDAQGAHFSRPHWYQFRSSVAD